MSEAIALHLASLAHRLERLSLDVQEAWAELERLTDAVCRDDSARQASPGRRQGVRVLGRPHRVSLSAPVLRVLGDSTRDLGIRDIGQGLTRLGVPFTMPALRVTLSDLSQTRQIRRVAKGRYAALVIAPAAGD